MSTLLTIAIDGNEANVLQRVGSNVYAFELLCALERLTRNRQDLRFVILLSTPRIADWPNPREGWKYQVITPKPLWTQFALPLHLFAHKEQYDLFFTPGHYAPRLCPVPYISSVMDTAYLEYPKYFKPRDLLQLKHWTAYSVKHAQKVIVISKSTKYSVIEHYKKRPEDCVVVYPALTPPTGALNPQLRRDFFTQKNITDPFILFVGTLQPRKNVTTLISAFELLCERWNTELQEQNRVETALTGAPVASREVKLVLAGKVGWLAESTLQKIARSPVADHIILTGFISEQEKQALIERARCLVLIGLHEGFGIPPLEALEYGTLPIVSNTSSLPEVVGNAGITVPPTNPEALSRILERVLMLPKSKKRLLQKKGREQARKFSWESSAKTLLQVLVTEAAKTHS